MLWIKQFIHDSLEGSRCIGQPKWQDLELTVPKGSSECSFGSVIRFQQYLVKSRSGVQAGKVLGAMQFVKQVINSRQRISITYRQLVVRSVVHQHPQPPFLLLDQEDGAPIG